MNATGAAVALPAALLDPATYPHPVDAPVRLVETHVSWVALTGPCAYKVKKPLRLSFLDYSTAERRAHCCAEELRLNRRFAPDLYLDVVTITRDGNRLRIGSNRGEVVDHAVRMVQFDPREELDALVERGEVRCEELDALGTQIAAVHSHAARSDSGSGFGSPARVRQVLLDNFAELSALALHEPVPRLMRILRDWADATAPRLQLRWQQRLEAGWIRECHGDLHCANAVRWRDRLTAFDGIEFDPALRHIDVAADIAFLTMDLAARGRRDLRHAALDAWANALGDFDALPLLPWYETYRALVRAKVAALRARQRGERPETDPSLLRYLTWAERRTQPTTPRLVLCCGLSGSGKTWLARRVAPTLEALHLRSDVERKRLAGLDALADSRSPPDGGLYTREFNARTYARLVECAARCLDGGENVIVDAAHLRRNERAELLAVAQQRGCPAHILHSIAPLETRRGRVAARRHEGRDASEADVALLDRQAGYWEPFEGDERDVVIEIDTTQANADAEAIERLRATAPRT